MPVAVMIEGRLCAPRDQAISVFDRGFLYGDSVFETVRTYGGVPFELPLHLRRLERSARRVHIVLPVSLEQLEEEVGVAVAAAGNAESYVRVMVTRGQGPLGLDPALADRARRVIIASQLSSPPDDWYASGVAVTTYRTQRQIDATSAEGAKVGNYLVSVLAMHEARQAGAVEALIVDGAGRVLEGASSNVFLVTDGRLVTAPESAGILPGVTRAHVISLSRSAGVSIDLRSAQLAELMAADEAFITSSIREVVPVVRVDDVAIGVGRVGPLTRRLMDRFREFTRGADS